MRQTVTAFLLVGIIVLAGCSGSPGTGTAADPASGTDSGAGDESDSSSAGSAGTVNFYVSDKPGALEDFESLNVTISRVGFKKAKTADGQMGDAAADGNMDSMNGQREEKKGGWVEYNINETTVDLTRLAGENATQIDALSVPNGTYTKVFMYAEEVNGRTINGEQPRVKLPSEKLQLNSKFTIGTNESVDFVFDIKVIKAGKSGKYIIRPVISESGTDQPIRKVDGRHGKPSKGETGDKQAGSRDGSNKDEPKNDGARDSSNKGNQGNGGKKGR